VIDASAYAAWHGMTPMAKLLERLNSSDFFVEGRGRRIRDAAGRWYLDARSSLWNVTLGYDDERIVEAIVRQLRTLPFTTAIRYDRPSAVMVEYANALAQRLPSGLGRLRFGHSGSQMTEAAVLLSRFVRRSRGEPARDVVVALHESYHGTGAGAGALSGEPYFHESCGPLLPRVRHVEAPVPTRGESPQEATARGIGAIEAALPAGDVTAVMVEPFLGSRGYVFDPTYLRRLRSLCTAHDVHLIFDEVTTGLGRVGAYTRAEQVDVFPDMIVLGKGLTSGYVPLAALALNDDIYESAANAADGSPFPLGSTTDGHPLAMAAGLAVLEVLERDGVLGRVEAVGGYLAARLRELAAEVAAIADVRGLGLMWAIDLAEEDGTPWTVPQLDELRLAVEERGVLVSVVLGAITIAPPLTITFDEIDEVVTALEGELPPGARVSTRTAAAGR
jgi:4-aminobutyrate---pyruvate transaminase